MNANQEDCTTDKSKRWMEEAGFGHWPEIAKRYSIPLYAAPAPASAQGVFDAEWQAFTATRLRVLLRQVGVAGPFPDSDADLLGVAGTVLGQIRAALAQPASQSGDGVKTPIPMQAIKKILTEVMEVAGANGADSRSMPDEYVAVAHFACYPEEYAHPTKEPQ